MLHAHGRTYAYTARTPHVRRAHFLKICGARVRTAVCTALIQRRKPSSYTLPFVVLYQPLCAGGYPGLQRTSRKAEKRVSPSSDRRHASVAAAGGVPTGQSLGGFAGYFFILHNKYCRTYCRAYCRAHAVRRAHFLRIRCARVRAQHSPRVCSTKHFGFVFVF